jgi:hypothetical protein
MSWYIGGGCADDEDEDDKTDGLRLSYFFSSLEEVDDEEGNDEEGNDDEEEGNDDEEEVGINRESASGCVNEEDEEDEDEIEMVLNAGIVVGEFFDSSSNKDSKSSSCGLKWLEKRGGGDGGL